MGQKVKVPRCLPFLLGLSGCLRELSALSLCYLEAVVHVVEGFVWDSERCPLLSLPLSVVTGAALELMSKARDGGVERGFSVWGQFFPSTTPQKGPKARLKFLPGGGGSSSTVS